MIKNVPKQAQNALLRPPAGHRAQVCLGCTQEQKP